jgi:hypothetical protein
MTVDDFGIEQTADEDRAYLGSRSSATRVSEQKVRQ